MRKNGRERPIRVLKMRAEHTNRRFVALGRCSNWPANQVTAGLKLREPVAEAGTSKTFSTVASRDESGRPFAFARTPLSEPLAAF
jgi:hypothetical protein